MHHELYETDFHRGIIFLVWTRNKEEEDEHFLHLVIFSDETTFHNNGVVNDIIFFIIVMRISICYIKLIININGLSSDLISYC